MPFCVLREKCENDVVCCIYRLGKIETETGEERVGLREDELAKAAEYGKG